MFAIPNLELACRSAKEYRRIVLGKEKFRVRPSVPRRSTMGKIAHVLAAKGSQVHTIRPTDTVFDAVKKMVENNSGSLIVTDGDAIHGIITERDYLRNIVLAGRTSKTTQVREIMTSQIVVVKPDTPVEEAMAIMTDRRIRHLPVVDQGKLGGIVSIGDLVKQISQDRQFEVQYLTDYITGRYPG
jgi:CBS domain-containing protein